jgi:UDP-2,3-diacylglucosamine pyrophosphatase LpxH
VTKTNNQPTKKTLSKERLNDIGFRLILIHAFGITIPIVTGMVREASLNAWQFKLSYLYTIGIAFLIWEGNRYLLFTMRSYFDWFNKPLRKIAALILAISFYTIPVSALLLVIWYHIFLDGKINWNVVTTSTLMIMVCVVFITHVYETVNDLQKTAGSLLNDQFIMARIGFGKNAGFIIKDLISPDVPEQASNRSETETYAVFLSDLHIGSKYFMEEEFTEFVSWLSSPDSVARKIRYVLIGGDLVDGVGIYPNQDKELICQTIEEQLKKVEDLLSKIPNYIKIFIMPGNHDPGRRALPQPAIPKKYNSGLWEKENVFMVGNPAVISLNGVKVMMFHGQSIDDIVKTTPGLSYDKPTNVMKHLLRARHLSPIYGSQTPIAPEMEDLMVIDDIPDIFHVGHVHRAELDMYKGILLLNSGSWQKQTPFQASVGMTPNPGIALMVNLKTFKVYHENYNSNPLNNILQS